MAVLPPVSESPLTTTLHVTAPAASWGAPAWATLSDILALHLALFNFRTATIALSIVLAITLIFCMIFALWRHGKKKAPEREQKRKTRMKCREEMEQTDLDRREANKQNKQNGPQRRVRQSGVTPPPQPPGYNQSRGAHENRQPRQREEYGGPQYGHQPPTREYEDWPRGGQPQGHEDLESVDDGIAEGDGVDGEYRSPDPAA